MLAVAISPLYWIPAGLAGLAAWQWYAQRPKATGTEKPQDVDRTNHDPGPCCGPTSIDFYLLPKTVANELRLNIRRLRAELAQIRDAEIRITTAEALDDVADGIEALEKETKTRAAENAPTIVDSPIPSRPNDPINHA